MLTLCHCYCSVWWLCPVCVFITQAHGLTKLALFFQLQRRRGFHIQSLQKSKHYICFLCLSSWLITAFSFSVLPLSLRLISHLFVGTYWSSVVIHHRLRLTEEGGERERDYIFVSLGKKWKGRKVSISFHVLFTEISKASSFQRHKLLLTTPNYLRDLKLAPSEAHFPSPAFLMDSFQKGPVTMPSPITGKWLRNSYPQQNNCKPL